MVETAARKPIGIFDSGVGGLTVVKEICKKLPHENIIYLGDTARVPYGTRSAQTVQKYAIANTDFLLKQDIKLLVIACNTASAVATETLRDKYGLPIIDVVGHGARAAVAASRTKRIGIIGTDGTILSGAYQKEIKRREPASTIFTQACPLFVPLAEAGWCAQDDEVVLLTARRYLEPLVKSGIDTLVLGCTHYPILKDAIQAVMGPGIRLIDSAEETACDVMQMLGRLHIMNDTAGSGTGTFYVTDIPHRFAETGSRFLGRDLSDVSVVDIVQL
ncbi:MAG: glutamate racemase [Proteobacteria bacterium]|nr:glutamate racemase [Pseudomonadota bacterium]